MKNTKLKLDLDGKPLVVDLNQYKADKVDMLYDKVAELRIKNSVYSKFEKEEGETDDEWRERIAKENEKNKIRKKGEASDVFLKRIFDAKHDMYNLSFGVLNAIAEVFQLEAITEERFKSGNWMSIKKFIYDVLSLGDVPCEDFYVKDLD